MDAIVSVLIAGPPKTIGELETALGLRFDERWVAKNDFGTFSSPPFFVPGAVVSFSARYRWDMHHENPPRTIADLRGREVYALDVTFADGVDGPLRARFGEPRVVDGAHVYDTWIAKGNALSWSKKLPDWAVPREDAALRARYLEHLVALQTKEERARAAEVAPKAAGIVLASVQRNIVTIELVPPIPALDLVALFGWKDAIAESVGIYRGSWIIALVTGKHEYGLATVRANPEATLATAPTGPELPGVGPTGRKQLVAADCVRYLELAT